MLLINEDSCIMGVAQQMGGNPKAVVLSTSFIHYLSVVHYEVGVRTGAITSIGPEVW